MLIHNTEKHQFSAELQQTPLMEKGPDGAPKQQTQRTPTGDIVPLFSQIPPVKFPPGIFRMSAEDWERAQENQGFKMRTTGVGLGGNPLRGGATIKVVSNKDDLPSKEIDALQVIDATTDVPLLKDWQAATKPGKLRDAIELRILLFEDIEEHERRKMMMERR
jgi:hypothetical protein